MILWIFSTPIHMASEQRKSEEEEAELLRVCEAQQPIWALWRRNEFVNECYAEALWQLRATQSFPPAIVLKHYLHLDVISTHHIGAFLWTAAGIAQFGLARSSSLERQRHRFVGRLYMLAVVLLTVGFLRIDKHDLHADNDFRAAYPGMPPRHPIEHLATTIVLYGLQIWFVYTACKAGITARAKRFNEHRTWIVRHVASGLWVVAMRVFSTLLFGMLAAAIELGMKPPGGTARYWLFAGSMMLGTIASFAGSEHYLKLTQPKQVK